MSIEERGDRNELYQKTRQRSRLGELPSSLFREHEGGFPGGHNAPMYNAGQAIPPDIAEQQALKELPPYSEGQSPAGNWGSEPTYSTLPNNGISFTDIQIGTVDFNVTPYSLIVPQGRVYVLRNLEISVPFDADGNFQVNMFGRRVNIFVNGVNPFPFSSFVGGNFGLNVPLYLPVGAGKRIDINIDLGDESAFPARFKLTGDSLIEGDSPDTYTPNLRD